MVVWFWLNPVRGWLYYGLALNVLALVFLAVGLPAAGLLVGSTGALVWGIVRDGQRMS